MVLLAAASVASAAPCGTVLTASGCFVNVGGNVNYIATNFVFNTSNATGGATAYTGLDIGIDISNPSGTSMVLTFSKFPTPGFPVGPFAAAPGQTTGFIFSYDVIVVPTAAGSVVFAGPLSTNLTNFTSSGNASVILNTLFAGPVVSMCPLATVADPLSPCAFPPGPATPFMHVNNFVNLEGNASSVTLSAFTNVFNEQFAADVSTPEPTSLSLMLVGIAGLVAARKRHATLLRRALSSAAQ